MSIRRTGLLLLAIVALTPGAASATGHNADLSGDGTLALGSRLWGFHEMFAKTLPVPKPYRDLSVVADLSIYRGSENNTPQTLIGWMGGARYTLGGATLRPVKNVNARVTLSPYGLLGAFHPNGHKGAASAAIGGALDVVAGKNSSSEPGWGFRASVDRVFRNGAPDVTRISLGTVYRFGHQK